MSKTGTSSFFSRSLLIFVIRFLPLLATLLVTISFSRILDKPVYGGYQNFWVQVYLLNAIACMGLHAFIITYTPSQLKGIFQQLRAVHYIGLLVWVLLVATCFGLLRSNEGGLPFYIPFLFLVVYALSLIVESVLIAFKKFGALIFVSICYVSGFLWLHWTFLQPYFSVEYMSGDYDITALFRGLALLVGLKLLAYGLLAYWCIKTQDADATNIKPLKDIRSLWLHLGFYDVSQMVFRWLDKFIISIFLVEELSAVYFNGSIEIPFFAVVLGAVGSTAIMQLAANKNEDSTGYAVAISNYSSRILSAVVFPLFFFFLFFSLELFDVLFAGKYLQSVPIFMVAVFTMPLYAYHLTAILQNRHKGSIINKGVILDFVIAISLMYPFYTLLGLPGIALSIVVSSYIQAAYYLLHTGKILGVGLAELLPLKNWAVKLIVFFLLFITIHYLLSSFFSGQIVLLLGGVMAVVVTLVSLVVELRTSKQQYGDALSRT